VTHYRLTPHRTALIEEAKSLYRSETPKAIAIARLRELANGDLDELHAASERATDRSSKRKNPQEAIAAGFILHMASGRENTTVEAVSAPSLSANEQRLRELPKQTAFAELLELEPRLSSALAVAEEIASETSGAASSEDRTEPSPRFLNSVHKKILRELKPLVGPDANSSSAILRSETAIYVAVTYLLEVIFGPPKFREYWQPR
jgi:GAF domain-containing protein